MVYYFIQCTSLISLEKWQTKKLLEWLDLNQVPIRASICNKKKWKWENNLLKTRLELKQGVKDHMPLKAKVGAKMWIRCHFLLGSHNIMTFCLQRQKSSPFWTCSGCIRRASRRAPFLQSWEALIWSSLNDPEGYTTTTKYFISTKLQHWLSDKTLNDPRPKWRLLLDCSPIAIREDWDWRASKTKNKNLFNGLVSLNTTELTVWTLQDRPKHRKVEESFILRLEKNVTLMFSNITAMRSRSHLRRFLNPIKNLWGRMVREVYKNGQQFQTVDELRASVLTKIFPLTSWFSRVLKACRNKLLKWSKLRMEPLIIILNH